MLGRRKNSGSLSYGGLWKLDFLTFANSYECIPLYLTVSKEDFKIVFKSKQKKNNTLIVFELRSDVNK